MAMRPCPGDPVPIPAPCATSPAGTPAVPAWARRLAQGLAFVAAGAAAWAAKPPGGQMGNAPLNAAASTINRSESKATRPADSVQPSNQPSEEERILNLMRPLRVDKIALAPDGNHVAYVAADQYRVRIIIVDVNHPESPASVEVGQGNWWQQFTGATWSPPRVTYLYWATGQRLVFTEGTNGIYAVNADGKGLTKLVTAQDVGVAQGPNVSSLAEQPPPGMLVPPNHLDTMPGSPPTSLDPALRVKGQPDAGPVTSTPNITSEDDVAAPNSDDYIGMAFRPSRAVEGDTGPALPADLQPRTPRVIATSRADPEHIIVEASGVQNGLSGLYQYGLYKVDVESGAHQSLGEAELPGHEVLYDREGHIRIVLGAIGRTYLHVFPGRSLWRGAKPLDKFIHDPGSQGFNSKPENFFGVRSIPLGFDYDANVLYFASNQGRDTLGLYALDLKNGVRTAFSVESPDSDIVDPWATDLAGLGSDDANPLIFDEFHRQLVGVRLAGTMPRTRWLDPALAAIEAEIGRKFPGRTVELLQWDEHRTRYLALVSGRSDPGRYYLYTPTSADLVLCARRAPWLASESVYPSTALAFTTADGSTLSGSLTLPRSARIHPPPLVVLCPDGPGQTPPPEFDANAQAFAGMGFIVLRVNYRGSGGLGLKHLGAIRGAIDRAPLDDILAAIDYVRQQTPIDPKRIAIVGEGLGGYLALRAVQVHPERFRCAVSISAPVDLTEWVKEPALIAKAKARADDLMSFQTIAADQAANPFTPLDALHATMDPPDIPVEDSPDLFVAKARQAFIGNDRRALAAVSPLRTAQDVIRPIFIIQDETANADYISSAEDLRRKVEKQGGQVDFLTVNGRLETMDAVSHAKVLDQIESFLNLDFYSYNVEIGDVKAKD